MTGDRGFESTSLQRRVDCEPDFRGRIPTTTLFAALSVLDGTVIGRCMQRHRHLEFIRFLNADAILAKLDR